MKKQLLLLVMMLLPLVASAHNIEVQNADGVTIYYNYINDGTELEVTFRGKSNIEYSNEYTGNVVIPESVNYNNVTYSVTSIGGSAFSGCSGLTSITIPNSVTSIGGSAFSGCSGLTSITIPNSVTSIGGSAFSGCSGLTSITIPNSVTSIGFEAFQYCKGLTSVTIGNSVTSIGSSAFFGCSGLTSVTIPNSVTSIGRSAFKDCSGLTSVTIPNSVTSIGDGAFGGCSGLTSITIPISVTSIGSGAFKDSGWYNKQNDGLLYLCNWLLGYKGNKPTGDLKIVNGTKCIGNGAFSECSGLTSVTIPNTVTSIAGGAFYKCSGLTSVAIGNSVTSIGNEAFKYCYSLTSIEIPNSVTSIADDAFFACTGLIFITIPNSVTSIGNEAFNNCKSLTSIEIPNSVTSIADGTFGYCDRLNTVTLSKNLNSIGKDAFYNCGRLSTINCLNPIPPSTNGDTFICSTVNNNNVRDKNDIYNYAILYVPKGSKEAYSAAAEWRYFKNIKEIGEGDSEQVSYVNLTIQLGTTGFTRQSVKTSESYTFYIGSYGDNRVNAVTFNGEDVTNRLNNGYYTTPEIIGASILSVTYETTASAIQAVKQSNLKVMGYNGEINISDIESASDVTVYTVDGKLVDSIPSVIGSVRLQVPTNQLYIVKVANRTFKLAM